MRHIKPKMIAFLDTKLKDISMAAHARDTKNARLLFQIAAQSCVGIRERTNNNDGPMVELIQETIGVAEHESWCMAFVQTMLAYAEHTLRVTSPVVATEGVLDAWNRTPLEQRVKYLPLPGAIVLWRHGVTYKGHTGILLGTDGINFHAVEGNTTSGSENDPTGPVVREGGGVYYTKRAASGSGDMHVVGYLKPF